MQKIRLPEQHKKIKNYLSALSIDLENFDKTKIRITLGKVEAIFKRLNKRIGKSINVKSILKQMENLRKQDITEKIARETYININFIYEEISEVLEDMKWEVYHD